MRCTNCPHELRCLVMQSAHFCALALQLACLVGSSSAFLALSPSRSGSGRCASSPKRSPPSPSLHLRAQEERGRGKVQ